MTLGGRRRPDAPACRALTGLSVPALIALRSGPCGLRWVSWNPLVTDRLVLRAWRVEDAAEALGVYGHPDVARWLSPEMDQVPDLAAMRLLLQQWVAEDDRLPPPAGRWAIDRRDDGRLLGRAILLPLPPGREDLEVGWQLHPQVWGHGYGHRLAPLGRNALRRIPQLVVDFGRCAEGSESGSSARPRHDRSHWLCIASTVALLCPYADDAAERSHVGSHPAWPVYPRGRAELFPLLGDELTELAWLTTSAGPRQTSLPDSPRPGTGGADGVRGAVGPGRPDRGCPIACAADAWGTGCRPPVFLGCRDGAGDGLAVSPRSAVYSPSSSSPSSAGSPRSRPNSASASTPSWVG